jgi:hypothetical protein
MIEKIFVISFLVFAINYAMKDGEIFGFVGFRLSRILHHKLHNPAFDCVICMAPWYGTIIYWLVWAEGCLEWVVVVIAAMGLNAVIINLSPAKDE